MAPQARKPKKIILLSDGTGNSAAKINKTNVWRLYQALDLSEGDQIAYYDDGVGTSNLRILKILGGAFGIGLARNVRDLYKFLCQHYLPGDEIYVFGFSRGAFTARILVDMISRCGVLDLTRDTVNFSFLNWRMFRFGRPQKTLQLDSEQGLAHGVRFVHKAYRSGYNAWLSDALRWFGNHLTYRISKPPKSNVKYPGNCLPGRCLPVETVRFVGVWDTVSAYGLPIEELSDFIDRYIFPLKFPDKNLSANVHRARQALAIDDERQTFKPVLWNESGSNSPQIRQVWFPGMHANVGGGYPNDDLAHISLAWMIDEIRTSLEEDLQLRFKVGMQRSICNRAQATGKMHNSRAGMGISYRYSPRDIHALCNEATPEDKRHYVRVDHPIVHRTVIERISAGTDGYAPLGLPRSFEMDSEPGDVIHSEPDADKDRRTGLHERARHHIFWDRVNYFVMLTVATILAFSPLSFEPIKTGQAANYSGTGQDYWLERWISTALGWIASVWEGILGLMQYLVVHFSNLLPGFVKNWVVAWMQNPGWFVFLLLILLGVLLWNGFIERNIQRLSEAAWGHYNGNSGANPIVNAASFVENWTKKARNCTVCRRVYFYITKKTMPLVLSLAVLILLIGGTYRLLVHIPEVSVGICQKTDDKRALAKSREVYKQSYQPEKKPTPVDTAGSNGQVKEFGIPFDFETRTPCLKTGLMLEAGDSYLIHVSITDDWMDNTLPASPAGLTNWRDSYQLPLMIAVPGRRHVTTPWLALMGEIGPDSGQTFRVAVDQNSGLIEFVFEPLVSGELALYVNDAIYAWGIDLSNALRQGNTRGPKPGDWDFFYRNNFGKASITVFHDIAE